MVRTYSSRAEMTGVVKEALWLAWNACINPGPPSSMGWFKDRPQATKDEVFGNATTRGDYPAGTGMQEGMLVADYVFGRMMKLYLTIEGNSIRVSDSPPTPDYQAWCTTYPTYAALFDAAEAAFEGGGFATAAKK